MQIRNVLIVGRRERLFTSVEEIRKIQARLHNYTKLADTLEENLDNLMREMDETQNNLESALAWVHSQGASHAHAIAMLCDERLDITGALLGRVRNISRALSIIEREEAEGIK